MKQDFSKEERYVRAQKRVEEIKKFYKHLTAFILMHLFLSARRIYKAIQYGDSFLEAVMDVSNYQFIFWWAVALGIHAIATFGIPNLFSKDWEEQKIKEYMDKN